MKRARIMLASIAAVAVIAGGLAFKAKHLEGQTYFAATSPNVSWTTSFTHYETTSLSTGALYYYTTTIAADNVGGTETYIKLDDPE